MIVLVMKLLGLRAMSLIHSVAFQLDRVNSERKKESFLNFMVSNADSDKCERCEL